MEDLERFLAPEQERGSMRERSWRAGQGNCNESAARPYRKTKSQTFPFPSLLPSTPVLITIMGSRHNSQTKLRAGTTMTAIHTGAL